MPIADISQPRHYGLYFLQATLLGILALMALNGAIGGVKALRGPYETTYPECAIVERTLALVDGQPLYASTRAWPYLVAPYGPLTYYPAYLLSKMVHLESDREARARQIYFLGRTISFSAGIAILIWMWVVGMKIGLQGQWRLLPIGLFFCAPPIQELWSSYRPDFTMAALALWGWWMAWNVGKSKWLHIALSAILLTLAVLCKQTAIFSMAALLAWLLAQKRWREAVAFGVLSAIMLGVAILALYIRTSGAWFENTVLALHSSFHTYRFFTYLFSLTFVNLLPIAIGLGACLGGIRRDETSSAPRWAFVLSLLVTQCTAMRTGSNFYYYLEPYCWGIMLTSLCAMEIRNEAREAGEANRLPRCAWIIILSILLVPFLAHANSVLKQLPHQFMANKSLAEMNPALAQLLAATRGPILTVEGELYWMSKSPPTMMDPYLYSVRVAVGDLNAQDLIGKLANGEFEYVILAWNPNEGTPRYQGITTLPEPVITAIMKFYRPYENLGNYYILIPAR